MYHKVMNQGLITTTQETAKAVDQQLSALQQLLGSGVFLRIAKIAGAVAVFLLMLLAAKIVSSLVRQKIQENSVLKEENSSQQIATLVGDIVYYSLFIFAVFVAFQIVGFDVALILWGVSFWVGLAFKEVLGNMIAWVMILTTKEIKLGDMIEVLWDKNYFWRIEEITIRYTMIRTLDLRQVIIPNLTLINTPMKTFSSENLVKLKTEIGVHYNSDIDVTTNTIIQAVNSCTFVQEHTNTKALLTQRGESRLIFTVMFYVQPSTQVADYNYLISEVNARINQSLKEKNIKIAYPHMTLVLDNESL